MNIPSYISFEAPVVKTVQKQFEPPVLPEVPTLVPSDSLLHFSHTTEVVGDIGKSHDQLREFVGELASTARWYDGGKGNIVNYWV